MSPPRWHRSSVQKIGSSKNSSMTTSSFSYAKALTLLFLVACLATQYTTLQKVLGLWEISKQLLITTTMQQQQSACSLRNANNNKAVAAKSLRALSNATPNATTASSSSSLDLIHPPNLRRTHLMVAKTMSPSDVDETVQDILVLHDRARTNIRWKLFCWSAETRDLLHAAFHNQMQKYQVDIIYHERVLKTYFWYNHLREADIDKKIDYLWLLDGDVSIRHLAWDCFWNIQWHYKPAISQPALIDDPRRESHNWWTAVSHSSTCADDASYSKLLGVETSFIEQQAPLFRRDAWLAVRHVLDQSKLAPWNHSHSSWGIDFVWCGIVQEEILKQSYASLQASAPAVPFYTTTTTNDNTNTCQVDRLEDRAAVTHNDRPIGCMIVHATPVVHIDTNSYDDTNKDRRKIGVAQKLLYQETLPKYFRQACGRLENDKQCRDERVGIHRSFWMDDQQAPCQECRKWECTPYGNQQQQQQVNGDSRLTALTA